MQQEQQHAGKRSQVVVCAALFTVTTFGALGQAGAATVSGSQLLPISSIKASNSEAANPPAYAMDGNMSSRWSGYGAGVTLTTTFASTMNVHSVDIAWYRGDTRKNTFS